MKDSRPNKQEPLKELTPELMEGYLSGALSSQQRRQVEQFLEDNPFEAEAMEGLQAASGYFENDLIELENRLANKTRRPSRSLTKLYWPMAAAVSVMVIAGFMFYFLRPLDPVAPQVTIAQDSTQVLSERQAIEAPVVPKTPDQNEVPSSVEKTQKDIKPSFELLEKELRQKELALSEIPEATSTSGNSNAVPINDEVNEPVLQRGANQTTDFDIAVDLDMEEENEISSEDPAPAVYRDEKRKKTLTAAPSANKRTQPLDLPNAQPPLSLGKYLVQNTRYPKEAKSQAVKGRVLVSFVVNSDGKLSDFKIVEGLGHGCNKEAIRVLQQGPNWVPSEINGVPVQSRGTAEVHFPAKTESSPK